jgi:hypothetical protein
MEENESTRSFLLSKAKRRYYVYTASKTIRRQWQEKMLKDEGKGKKGESKKK